MKIKSFNIHCKLQIVNCKFPAAQRGVTLLEILLVMGIVVILAGTASLYLFGIRGSQDLDNDVKQIVAVLRDAQERSITQEGGLKWGVRFVNNDTDPDFYYLISSDNPAFTSSQGDLFNAQSATFVSTFKLRSMVQFTDPTSGDFRDFMFSKISGALNVPGGFPAPVFDNWVSLNKIGDSATARTIMVNDNGTITY